MINYFRFCFDSIKQRTFTIMQNSNITFTSLKQKMTRIYLLLKKFQIIVSIVVDKENSVQCEAIFPFFAYDEYKRYGFTIQVKYTLLLKLNHSVDLFMSFI